MTLDWEQFPTGGLPNLYEDGELHMNLHGVWNRSIPTRYVVIGSALVPSHVIGKRPVRVKWDLSSDESGVLRRRGSVTLSR